MALQRANLGPRKGNVCAQFWFIASRFKQTPLLRLTWRPRSAPRLLYSTKGTVLY